MFPVGIDDLIEKKKTLVDLYVQLSNEKYVLVVKAGSSTEGENLTKFKAKGLAYLYVKAEAFQALIKESLTIAGMAIGNRALDNMSKLSVLSEAIGAVQSEMINFGIDEQAVGHAKFVAEATMVVLASNSSLTQLMEKLQSLPESSSKHAIMVSMVSVMLGQGHEWVKPATLEKLALGGILHDVGKLMLPTEVISKDFSQMSADEKVIYQSHPEMGRHVLSAIKGLPDDVLLIVYEHHELADGSGFPKGTKDLLTSPLARVVSLANSFTDMIISSSGLNREKSARKVLDEIEMSRSGHFNRDAVRALRRIVDKEPLKRQAS